MLSHVEAGEKIEMRMCKILGGGGHSWPMQVAGLCCCLNDFLYFLYFRSYSHVKVRRLKDLFLFHNILPEISAY